MHTFCVLQHSWTDVDEGLQLSLQACANVHKKENTFPGQLDELAEGDRCWKLMYGDYKF